MKSRIFLLLLGIWEACSAPHYRRTPSSTLSPSTTPPTTSSPSPPVILPLLTVPVPINVPFPVPFLPPVVRNLLDFWLKDVAQLQPPRPQLPQRMPPLQFLPPWYRH